MSHNLDCHRAYRLIDAFVRARAPKAQYATTEEIVMVYEYFSPCRQCQVKPDMLSKMTGRLYEPIWNEHVKREMGFTGRQGDIIDVIQKS